MNQAQTILKQLEPFTNIDQLIVKKTGQGIRGNHKGYTFIYSN